MVKVEYMLDMLYKPSEVAEVLGVSVETIYRSYLPAGAPNQLDKQGRIWIYGPAFSRWAAEYLSARRERARAPMLESEGWCCKCNQVVAILNPRRRDVRKRLNRLVGKCPECGGVVNRFLTGEFSPQRRRERGEENTKKKLVTSDQQD